MPTLSEPSVPKLRETFKIPNNVLIVNAKVFFTAKPLVREKQNFTINQGDNTDLRDPGLGYNSSLNTIVYTDILFPKKDYTGNDGNAYTYGADDKKSIDYLRFNAVLITVSQSKKIVKTEIQGRDGTVKEYIGMDDYQVALNGVITKTNGNRPVQEIIALKKMLDAPIPVDVVCTYLNDIMNIHSMVVTDWSMGEESGSYSYQPFSINFISDVPQELKLINP